MIADYSQANFADDKLINEMLPPMFTKIDIPVQSASNTTFDVNEREHWNISVLPTFKSKRRYFSELSEDDIKKALDYSTTAMLSKSWDKMITHSLKYGQNYKQDVVNRIEEVFNTFLSLRDPTSDLNIQYKVKYANLEGVRSEVPKVEPAFYTKWNIIVHRDNKAYGFSFDVIFLHLGLGQEKRLYLCSHDNHSVLFEDAVVNATKLGPDYASSSSSSAFSPWSA